MRNIYVFAKLTIDTKSYTGAAIGYSNDLGLTERNAIKNLLRKMRRKENNI